MYAQKSTYCSQSGASQYQPVSITNDLTCVLKNRYKKKNIHKTSEVRKCHLDWFLSTMAAACAPPPSCWRHLMALCKPSSHTQGRPVDRGGGGLMWNSTHTCHTHKMMLIPSKYSAAFGSFIYHFPTSFDLKENYLNVMKPWACLHAPQYSNHYLSSGVVRLFKCLWKQHNLIGFIR